jgi:hypothetical protein
VRGSRALAPLLTLFGLAQLALAALMVVAPGTFFSDIGPYGVRNDHYLADLATFSAALSVVFLVAARRPSWRVPVLVFAVLQYVLHSVNHLVDVGNAHKDWLGPANLIALAAAAALLGWMLSVAAREAR